MEIQYFDEIASTQIYLKKKIKQRQLFPPVAVFTENQTNGIASQNRLWQGKKGNFFLSFALRVANLPQDLPKQCISIYFSYLMKTLLKENGSQVFIKWPNDFYIKKKKIGGAITSLIGQTLICGIGLNKIFMGDKFGVLDIEISNFKILELFLKKVEQKISWQEVFSQYSVEFPLNYEFNTHHKEALVSLKNSVLQEDGSLIVNGERILNLR